MQKRAGRSRVRKASGDTFAKSNLPDEGEGGVSRGEALAPGRRVRLRSASHVIELRSSTGQVVRPDTSFDYYFIHLDHPALYHHADGRLEELDEIAEDIDNLDLLPD